MAIPNLYSNMSVISAAETTTSWTTWGVNNSIAQETEIVREGSASVGCSPKNTGDFGFGYDIVSPSIDLTANLVAIWVYTTPGFYGSNAIYVRLGSSTTWTNNCEDWYVGGSNFSWTGSGWHLVVLDANRASDAQPGATGVTKSAVTRVGIGFNHTATASKSTISAIDVMYYGTNIVAKGTTSSSSTHAFDAAAQKIIRPSGSFITDGFLPGDVVYVEGTTSNEGYHEVSTLDATGLVMENATLTQESETSSTLDGGITLEDIYDQDGPTSDDWFGVVAKDPVGVWIINYPLVIGDDTGTERTFFVSRGEQITLSDQPLDTGVDGTTYLSTVEDTGANTIFLMGDSSDTGDNRVGFAGSFIAGQPPELSTPARKAIDFTTGNDVLDLFGTTFQSIDGGMQFGPTATHYITNCSFVECGQIDLGQVEARNLTFSGYTPNLGEPDTGAALLWDSSIDVKNSRFLANYLAIEHTDTGSEGYIGLTFAGNTIADIYMSVTGELTVTNYTTSDALTWFSDAGGVVTISSPFTHYLTDIISGSEVTYVYSGDTGELYHVESVGGDGLAQYDYDYTGDALVDILVFHVDYDPYEATVTLTNSNATLPIAQVEDPVYYNP
jgi:hypothetical protein